MAAPSHPGHYAAAGAAYAPAAVAYAPAATYPAGAKGLVTHPNGAVVPVEPIGVQAARADHLAAKAAYGAPPVAYAPAGYGGYGYGH